MTNEELATTKEELNTETVQEAYEVQRMTQTVNRLAYTQLVIKMIAAYLVDGMRTPLPLVLLVVVDMLYLQFERNQRGVNAFKIPTVTILYYVALSVIWMGW